MQPRCRQRERDFWKNSVVPGTAIGVTAAAVIGLIGLSGADTLQVLSPAEIILRLAQDSVLLVAGCVLAVYGCWLHRRSVNAAHQPRRLGPYSLLRLLGSGGMGAVYLAEHELLKRLCAVKLIRQDRATSRAMLRRFEREVKATARLTHWNTVQIYDYGQTAEGTFYYAMEYLRGMNLRQLVEQHGPIPPGRVVYLLRQLCHALHEAGQHGLVHQDIKPSNIFLAERGRLFDVVKLLDFGLVRPAWTPGSRLQTPRSQLQGSPRFMCPEQARGLKPDCRGDLYSLACVAFYLLSGRPPFQEYNPAMLVMAHGTMPCPTFHEIGCPVPDDLADVILRCLSKHPDDRYQSPRELLEAIEACDCSADWTWQDAERWWERYSTQLPADDEGTPLLADLTVEFDAGATMKELEPTLVSDDPSLSCTPGQAPHSNS